jgi:lysophospholipase L1-like esterase
VAAVLTADLPAPLSLGELELYNFAGHGYDLQQTVDYLERLLTQKKPDVIVVGICLNDIIPYHGYMLDSIENYSSLYSALGPLRSSALVALAARAWLRGKVRYYPAPRDCQLRRDNLAAREYRGDTAPDAALLAGRAAAALALGASWPLLHLFDDYADREKFFVRIARPLARLAALGLKDRVRVAVWPADAGVSPYWLEPISAKIEREARRHGLRTVDLTAAYKAGCRAGCFNGDQIHFNRYASALMLEQIAEAARLALPPGRD